MNSKPRILLFDIETAPNTVYTWGHWEQDVIDVIEDWYILSFVAKWLDSPKIISKGLISYPNYRSNKTNDKELVKDIWKLFDEADIIIGHNGDEFDIKKCQTRFLKYGLNSPSAFKSIDTKKVAKRYFRFDSNKLNELGRELKVGHKLPHQGFALWKGCMAGNPDAWKTMLAYNKQDVILLEKVYLKLRPYMNNHPNWNIYLGTTHSCPNCGSTNVVKQGVKHSLTGSRQQYQCRNCFSWSAGENIKRKIVLR